MKEYMISLTCCTTHFVVYSAALYFYFALERCAKNGQNKAFKYICMALMY